MGILNTLKKVGSAIKNTITGKKQAATPYYATPGKDQVTMDVLSNPKLVLSPTVKSLTGGQTTVAALPQSKYIQPLNEIVDKGPGTVVMGTNKKGESVGFSKFQTTVDYSTGKATPTNQFSVVPTSAKVNPISGGSSSYSPAPRPIKPDTNNYKANKQYYESQGVTGTKVGKGENAQFIPNYGFGGQSGADASGGTSGLSFSPNPYGTSGMPGAAGGGGAAYTGLLGGAGGLSTPAVIGEGSEEDTKGNAAGMVIKGAAQGAKSLVSPFFPKVANAQGGTSFMPGGAIDRAVGNAVGMNQPAQGTGMMSLPNLARAKNAISGVPQAVQTPSVAPEISASTLTNTSNRDTIDRFSGSLGASEQETMQAIQDEIAAKTDELNNLLMQQGPMVEETPEQFDWLSQLPELERPSIQAQMDQVRQSLGIDQMTAQKTSLMEQINSTNEVYRKFYDDVKKNPDLPAGLAQRRLQTLNEKHKEQLTLLTDQLDVVRESIMDANQSLNQQFQIIQAEEEREYRKKQDIRQNLNMIIQSGAIGGFSDSDIISWSQKVGIPAASLRQLKEQANKPNVDIKGDAQNGFYKLTTDKKGNVSIEQLTNALPKIGASTELRKEFNGLKTTSQFETVAGSYTQINSAYQQALQAGTNKQTKAAADQVLITAFNKMLDPNSVVREGEYARSVEGQSVMNQLYGKAQAALRGGTGLTDSDREAINAMTQRLYTDYVRTQNKNILKYRDLAESEGADPDKVATFIPTDGLINKSNAQNGDVFTAGSKTFFVKNGQPIEILSDRKYQPADILNAISNVESGGKYDAIGPVTKSGDRAYGRYQIMGANIPAWSKEVYGKPVTVAEFINNPAIQDEIALAKITDYYKKYGNPEDVASVWFSGRPASQNTSKDVTGTSVPQYISRVMSYLG